MGAPFTQLYVHLVWATYGRLPLLKPEVEPPLFNALSAKCSELKCRLMAVGCIEDHIHLLVQLHPTVSIAELAKQLKGNSSHWMNHVVIPEQGFRWQGAYGAFTVSKRGLLTAMDYCRNQREHHQRNETYPDVERWELGNARG